MPKIDLSYLELVSDGDKAFVQDFIHTFEHSSYPLVEKMRVHLISNDLEKLGKAAHQLKPSVKMLKLPCAESVEALQHEPEKATIELLAVIQEECESAIAQLKEWEGSL